MNNEPNSNNAPSSNEGTDEVANSVTSERNKLIKSINQKVFKGKLYTWIALYGILATVITCATPVVVPIVTSISSGEEKKEETISKDVYEQQKKQYEYLLQELKEMDTQEDASYQLQIDLLKEELEEKKEKIQELEDKSKAK